MVCGVPLPSLPWQAMQPDLKRCSPFLAFGGFEYFRTCAKSTRVLAKTSAQKVRMRNVACTVKSTPASLQSAAMVRYLHLAAKLEVIDDFAAATSRHRLARHDHQLVSGNCIQRRLVD